MSDDFQFGCAKSSTQNEELEIITKDELISNDVQKKEDVSMIQVGKPAPTFKTQGYHNGKFVNVDLEDYKGKWVLLCFYPGDFTFV